MKRPVVLLLGKLPPPYMGPAIATRILLDSSLKEHFQLIHLDTRAHRSLESMGRWSMDKAFRTLLIYIRMKWLILRYRPRLCIVPVSQSGLGFLKDSLFVLIARGLFTRAVFHLRGSNFRNWYEQSDRWMKPYVRFVLKRVSGVIVQGERLRPVFSGLVPEERIHVVPNGADYPILPDFRRHHPFKALYLANLQASKGIEDVLEAVRILKNAGIEEFEVEVAGSWRSAEMQRKCTEFVEKHRLPVRFAPAVTGEQKWEALTAADAFLFTPRDPEGHPWVIVEAQAAGLPIIATDRGAISEAVADGQNGFIVPLRDPDAIAERLKRLMNDESLRLGMAKESRRTYEQRYTEKAMVARMREAIEKSGV